MLIGMDVSTSITGYTLLDEDEVILNGAWDTRKFKDFFDKARFVQEGLDEIFKKYLNLKAYYYISSFNLNVKSRSSSFFTGFATEAMPMSFLSSS